jgi:hypothetical protein
METEGGPKEVSKAEEQIEGRQAPRSRNFWNVLGEGTIIKARALVNDYERLRQQELCWICTVTCDANAVELVSFNCLLSRTKKAANLIKLKAFRFQLLYNSYNLLFPPPKKL